jgi:hypothetical protein
MLTLSHSLNGCRLRRGLGYCYVLEQCPLQWLLDEILYSLNNRMYYSAISLCFTLPHICSSLERSDGRGERDGYYSWYNRYIANKFSYLSAEDAYAFRCGVLHQARFGGLPHKVSRVFFLGESKVTIANALVNDIYVHSARDFCSSVASAVWDWWEDSRENPVVVGNLRYLVRYHANGIAPVVRGITAVG